MADRNYAEVVDVLRSCKALNKGWPVCVFCDYMNTENCLAHSRIDAADAIENLLFERDKYKSFFDRIANLPDCNTCLKKNECEFVPRAGEHTRINCAFYVPDPREVRG